MHVSSTEPRCFHVMGELSTLPEKYGVDFLWWVQVEDGPRGWAGVQRKEVKDLMRSVADGRLGRELAQMEPLIHTALVIEGSVDYVGEEVVCGRDRVSIDLWDAVLWALQESGVKLTYSSGTMGTRYAVERFERWTRKTKHSALKRTRDQVPRNSWGQVDHRGFAIHLLTGLPGVGEGLAARIVDRFGGVPWRWTVSKEELMEVEGIGKVKAKKLVDALGVLAREE